MLLTTWCPTLGNPLQPGTLHFQMQSDDGALNDYEETITCVGNAIDKYSASSEYCVYGFGAKFGDGIVRHLFQCGPNPTVQGVNGILEAYRNVFRSGGITMSGPTVFVSAIQAAAVRARKFVSGSRFDILGPLPLQVFN
jgi:Copine